MADLERQGYAAASGIVGVLLGALTALKIIKKSLSELIESETATHVSRIAELEDKRKEDAKRREEDNNHTKHLLNEFKNTTERTLDEFKNAYERHVSLVVYRDTCGQCNDKHDAKYDGIMGKLDLLIKQQDRR